MRFFVLVCLVGTGCYATTMGLHSGSMTYEASGLNAPTSMEAAAADRMSADADMVRAQARTMEAHPELLRGYGGYGYGGYYGGGYGYGGAPQVNPNYYYPNGYGQPPAAAPASTPALEERATGLEDRTTGLETLLREHIEEEGR